MSRPARSWSRIASSVASSCACAENSGATPPQLLGAHARREAAGELLAVDQPVRLRVGADERGRQVVFLPFGILGQTSLSSSSPARARRAAPPAPRRRGSGGGRRCRRRRSACRHRPCVPPATATARPSRATRRWFRCRSRSRPPCRSSSTRRSRRSGSGTSRSTAFDRAEGVECLLVTVAVQQRRSDERPQRQISRPSFRYAREEFLEQTARSPPVRRSPHL